MEPHDEGLVSIAEAARATGLHRKVIERRIHSGALASFDLPSNRLVRLVRLADVEALKVPVPRARQAGAATETQEGA